MKYTGLVIPLVLSIIVVGIVSCQKPTPTEEARESPLSLPTLASSPLPALTSPLPGSAAPSLPAVPFRLDKPVQAGDTRVTGSGPAGVPIRLEDVTFVGRLIALGRIDEDGTFELILSVPLEARHRVGLTVDLSGTSWTLEDLQSEAFKGDEAMMVPQVGFYFDTAMVQEP